MRAGLHITLLGNAEVRRDGAVVTGFRSSKAQALLCYLAVTGRPHTRPALAGLLWGDMPEASARRNLTKTLSNLRQLVGPHLDITHQTVGFNRDSPYWLDVEVFESLVSSGSTDADVEPLREAVELYRGDFLEGFYVRNAPEFEDWALAQRARLRELALQALHTLSLHYTQQGDAGRSTALDYTTRLLALEPWREEAHRSLMLLLALGGQRGAALAQYETCRQVLAEELGAEPGAETTVLYQRIRDGELDELRPSPVSTPPASLPAPRLPAFLESEEDPAQLRGSPFIGRERELAQLDGFLEQALAGQGGIAFVIGEAGQGKTSLLNAFARRAQEERPGLIVVSGRCDVYTGLGDPYLPFRDVMNMLTGDVESQWATGAITRDHALHLWRLLPYSIRSLVERGPSLVDTLVPSRALANRGAAFAPEGAAWLTALQEVIEREASASGGQGPDQGRLFAEYAAVLEALAEGQPLLLFLDDLQWADLSSISLLSHLARRVARCCILIIGAYRPEDVAQGRDGGQHPLGAVLSELKRRFGDVWVNLDQMGPVEGREFVDALLDTEPNRLGEEFRAALHHQTEGHPLFTIELLRAMQQSGDLVRDPEGHWAEGAALNWGALPARVEAVIEERVGRLEAGLRDVLAVASVEGETFTAQVVARVQGLDERPVLGVLSQELEGRHHLVQSQGEVRVDHQFLSRFCFTHMLFQKYLYNTFSPGERRLLHGEIAAALEDLYREEGEKITVQLARHYAEAAQVEQAVDYLLLAGDRARDMYAFQEATDFYERALAFLKEQGDKERAARTLMKLGLTHHLAFQFQRARQAYEEGFALWQRAGASPTSPLPPAPHPLRLLWREPVTLDPTLVKDTTSGEIIQHLFSGLVALSAELDVVPEVARSWDVREGGERYIFHLRHDMQWSDGAPVTAEDFVYAWRRTLDPAHGSTNARYLYNIKGAQSYHQGQLSDPNQVGVHALDPTTLLVELEGPTSYLPQLLTQAETFPAPRHVVEAHGEAWTQMSHLVSNGPFMLEDWQPGRSMLLVRNPRYPGQFTGNVQAVALTLNVDEPAEYLAMYEADHVDMLHLRSRWEASTIRQRYAAEYFIGPRLVTIYVGLDVSQPPFDDPRVRRAFALAIDKEKLASVSRLGHFPATGGFVPPGMAGHSPGIGLPYDPDGARILLAEAGYPDGKGFPVIEGQLYSRDQFMLDLVDHWHKILGVEVVWQIIDWGLMLDQLERGDPPPVFRLGWTVDYPDPDNPLRVGDHVHSLNWQNETYIELVEKARRITDHEERMKLYQQADRILVEEAAIVPVFYGRRHLLIKPWIRRYSLSSMGWPLWKDVIIEPH